MRKCDATNWRMNKKKKERKVGKRVKTRILFFQLKRNDIVMEGEGAIWQKHFYSQKGPWFTRCRIAPKTYAAPMNPIIFEKQMEARGREIGENVLKASITYFTPVVCSRTPIRPNVSQAGNDLKRKYANISSIKLRLLSRYVLIPGSRDKKKKRETRRKRERES